MPADSTPSRGPACLTVYGAQVYSGSVLIRHPFAEAMMTKRVLSAVAGCVLILVGFVLGMQSARVDAQQVPGAGFAAVPGLKGGQDIFGPYEAVPNWPKPMSESLPDHNNWTYSQSMDVFAESPNRVFFLQKGELVKKIG